MVAVVTPVVALLTPPASTKLADGLPADTVGASLLPVIEKLRALVWAVAVPSVT